MKKVISWVLCIMLCFTFNISAFAYNSEDVYKSNIVNEDDIHIISAVLVRNGVAYPLSNAEYNSLITRTAQTPSYSVTEENPTKTINPRAAIYYRFVTQQFVDRYDANKIRRVSPIYKNPTSVSVTASYSFTRSQVAGTSVQIATVDNVVTSSFNVGVTCSSSTSQSVTETFTPNGAYTYYAITFTPHIAYIGGNYQMWQIFEGEESLLSSSYCTFEYPIKGSSSSFLDGIYALAGSNSQSSFPALA